MLRNLVQKAVKSEARMGSVYPVHRGGPEPIQNHLVIGVEHGPVVVQTASPVYSPRAVHPVFLILCTTLKVASRAPGTSYDAVNNQRSVSARR